MKFRRALSLLLCAVMAILVATSAPSAVTASLTAVAEEAVNVMVRSAPLERASEVRSGMVRVRLLSLGQPSSLTVTAAGNIAVSGAASLSLTDGESAQVAFSAATGALTLTHQGQTYAMGQELLFRRRQTSGVSGVKIAQARRPGNVYPGDLQLLTQYENGSYTLYVVMHVYLEYYLYGVVPYEMGSSSALEALKAQAVAARTYTLRAMNSNAAKRYDLVDTTADQVYNGSPSTHDRAAQAVDETKGIVLLNDGRLTGTYYTASNGGQTESARNAWGSSGVDYLTVKDDPFDRLNPYSSTRKLTIYADFAHASQNQTLKNLLQSRAGTLWSGAEVTILRIDAVTPHTPKYASPSRLYTKMDFDLTALVDGQTQTATLTFDIFGELESSLGLSINSTKNELWSVTQADGQYLLTVGRYGHGIGMSQRGAQQMANTGYTYDQILGFYYENCVRMQYTFTHTILSPVGEETVTATEAPATISPAAQDQAMVTLVNMEDVLSVRLRAAEDGALLTTLPAGTSVTVLAKGENWTLIRAGRIVGYVRTEHLTFSGTPPTQSSEAPTPVTSWAVVTGSNSLNLRSAASYDAPVQSTIPGGAVLCAFGTENGWVSVQYGTKTGYCAAEYLTMYSTYPGQTSQTGRSAMVKAEAALRATASTGAVTLMTLPKGVQVTVESSDGTWSRVEAGGVVGYVLTAQLDFQSVGVTITPQPTPIGAQEALVNSTASTLNLRSGPGTDYDVLAEIPKGTRIVVTAQEGQWCAVRWGGLSGYVMTKYLSFDLPTTEPVVTPQPTATPVVTPEPTATTTPAPTEAPEALEDSMSTGAYTAWVTAQNAPMRQTAGTEAAIVAYVTWGTSVTVLGQESGWCLIRIGQQTGYVLAEQLACEQPNAPLGQKYVSTQSDSLAMREQPDSSAAIVKWLPRGALVTVLAEQGTWSYVSYGGQEGYCAAQYLSDNAPGPVVLAADTPILDVTLADAPGWTAVVKENDAQEEVLRQWCSLNAPEASAVKSGETVEVLQKGNIWCKVRYEGKEGYCLTEHLTRKAPES